MNSEGEFGRILLATLSNLSTQHTSMPTAPCSLYVFAHHHHQSLYACSRKPQDADLEKGSPFNLLPGLKLIEPLQMAMDDIVTLCCEELVSVLCRFVGLNRSLTREKVHHHLSASPKKSEGFRDVYVVRQYVAYMSSFT